MSGFESIWLQQGVFYKQDHPSVDMKILVRLSCTMCPDLVVAAQRIAAENPRISAEVYDIRHFEQLKSRYNVMSVPCLVINDKEVSFGKKNVNQLWDMIRANCRMHG